MTSNNHGELTAALTLACHHIISSEAVKAGKKIPTLAVIRIVYEHDKGVKMGSTVTKGTRRAEVMTTHPNAGKIVWVGQIMGVQPRIRLLRSYNERQHSYLGYVVRINGKCGDQSGEFLVAVGPGAHQKHRFQAGMELSGLSLPVADPRKETASFYQTSGIKLTKEATDQLPAGPPFISIPPDLPTYRERGSRRLSTRTYEAKCSTCVWGCRMPVEIIIDPWNPSRKQYRFETFCYGPKSCAVYRPGPNRKVPGYKGTPWVEEDWVDEDAILHRGPDD